jgi:hypothetical protein
MLHNKLAELYFYDVNTGKLAIGACAIDSLLEQAVELALLRDVLINKNYDNKVGMAFNVEDWTNINNISYGHWLIDFAR